MAPDDIVEADFIYPGFKGENTFLYFSPNYKFYFLDQQHRDEIWVFKQFDSQEGVAASKDPGRVSKPSPLITLNLSFYNCESKVIEKC